MWKDKTPKNSHTLRICVYSHNVISSHIQRVEIQTIPGIGKLFKYFFFSNKTEKDMKTGRRRIQKKKSRGKKYAKTTFGKYGNWLNLSQSPNKFNKKKLYEKRHTIFPSIQKKNDIDTGYWIFPAFFSTLPFEIEYFRNSRKSSALYYDDDVHLT